LAFLSNTSTYSGFVSSLFYTAGSCFFVQPLRYCLILRILPCHRSMGLPTYNSQPSYRCCCCNSSRGGRGSSRRDGSSSTSRPTGCVGNIMEPSCTREETVDRVSGGMRNIQKGGKGISVWRITLGKKEIIVVFIAYISRMLKQRPGRFKSLLAHGGLVKIKANVEVNLISV
jgi:hypothetical protein